MNPANFVTGTIIALLGKVNTNGVFITEDYTFAYFPTPHANPSQLSIPMEKPDLFANIEWREFVAILGGLEFMSSGNKFPIEYLLWKFRGFGISKRERKLFQAIKWVVLGGCNIIDLSHTDEELGNIDEVVKGSFWAEENNVKVYDLIDRATSYFEEFVHTLSEVVDVTIMPSLNDVTSAFYP